MKNVNHFIHDIIKINFISNHLGNLFHLLLFTHFIEQVEEQFKKVLDSKRSLLYLFPLTIDQK